MNKLSYFILTIFLSMSIFISSSNITQDHSPDSTTEDAKQQNDFDGDFDDDFAQVKDLYFITKSILTLHNITCLAKINFHFIELLPLNHFTSPLIRPPIFSV